jgi:hypothetical protein
MATNMKGGGYGSRQHVEKPIRTGSGSKGVSPGWAGQKGQLQGNHITDDKNTGYTGEKKFTGKNFQPVKFGNEVALNVGKGGCGTGRTIYKTGSQDQYGSGGPQKPAGREILSEFGPDYRKP